MPQTIYRNDAIHEDAPFFGTDRLVLGAPVGMSSPTGGRKGVMPWSETTTQVSTERAASAQSAPGASCDGPLSDRGEDITLKAWREEQLQTRAEVGALQARCAQLDDRLAEALLRIESASLACRVPLLVGDAPQLRRLPRRVSEAAAAAFAEELAVHAMVCSASRPSTEALGPPPGPPPIVPGHPLPDPVDAEALAAVTLHSEFKALREKLQEVKSAHDSYATKLDAALDATRTGIAGLARDLHYDKQARKKVFSDLQALAHNVGQQVVNPALESATRQLQAELRRFVQQEVSKVQGAIDSRMQLFFAELRGKVQRHAGELEKEGGAPYVDAVVGRRCLSDWLPESSDGDINATKQMLMQLRVFEHMAAAGSTPDDLVSRPTTRFLHRVVVAIKHATGYPSGILEDWPGPAEAKVDFVERVWENVSRTLGLQDMEFSAQDVLRCTNRKQTRRLLQLLAIAASKERADATRTPRMTLDLQLPLAPLPPPSGRRKQLMEDAATSICWH